MRGNNRIPTRLIHSSQSVDKKFKKKKENRKENLYRDVFLLEENNEEESEEDSSSDINIVILYNKEKINTKFSQNRPFCDFVKFLEKKYFKVGFEENYKIYYENKEISMGDKRKINKIVNIKDNNEEIKFTLKAMKKTFLLNSKISRIYIQLENIPSFMDLSEQIYKFIQAQEEEIDYDINYKDNSCRILFSSQEISFSFVAYMTNIKFSNKYYRKLKIDIKYSPLNATNNKKNNLRYMSEENNKLNNINNTIDSIRNNMRTYKSYKQMNSKGNYYYYDTYENDYYEDNFKSIRDSSPYDYEKELEKQKKIKDKKNWVGNKDFFTSVNKKSFNRLLRPKNRLFLKKINVKGLNSINTIRNRNEKNDKELRLYETKTSDNKFKNS
jgi:hypothetical protein